MKLQKYFNLLFSLTVIAESSLFAVQSSQKYCTIRLFTANTINEAKNVVLKLPASQQDEIRLFHFKSNMIVGQYGISPTCKELKPMLQTLRKEGFSDAYFLKYNPNNTSLHAVEEPQEEKNQTPLKEDAADLSQAETSFFSSADVEPTLSTDVKPQEPKQEEDQAASKESIFDSIETRGTIGAVFNSYSTDKTPDTLAVEGNADITKEYEWGKAAGNLAFLYDFTDHRRRYIMANELYLKYQMSDATVVFGRTIRNWGVLEAFNISDVFNTKNYLSDSFDMSNKYGALNGEYTKQVDDDIYSVIVKFEERKQPYPATDNVYNFYHYNSNLNTEKGEYRPSIYLKYSGYTSTDELQADYTLILQNGYDNKRDIIESLGEVDQEAYLVNKIIGYGVIGYGNFTYKLEAAYTDVIDYSEMSDYLQIGAGVEYLPSISFNGAEIRLLGEYYRYHYFDDDKKRYVDFSEMFDHDLFLGVQSSFGDAGSSEIKGGVLSDLINREQVYLLTFGTRMKQNYRLSMEWRVIAPGNTKDTAIGRMGQFNQAIFRANYFF